MCNARLSVAGAVRKYALQPSIYTRELTIYMPKRQLFIYLGKITRIHPQSDPKIAVHSFGAGVLSGKNAAEAPTHS